MSTIFTRRGLVAASLVTLAGGTGVAFAQMGGGMMGGGMGRGPAGGMMGGGMMGGGMMGNGPWTNASYLDALKGELGITAAQEPAWKDYADTVSGVAETMQNLHQTMYESMGTASWEERRNMMNAMFQARQDGFKSVQEAADKLMQTLTPEQKQKAEEALPGLAYGPGMMRRR